MNPKHISSFFLRTACLLLFVAASLPSLHAQNFRGAINGTVTDSSGALIPGATVQIVNVGTNASYNQVSTSAGQFVFNDLPLGNYNLTVTAAGFSTQTIQNVPVSAGQTYTQVVKMSVAAAGTTVQVQANALALDTTSTVQANDLPTATVQNVPLNGRDFTQLLASMPGYAGNPQAGGGSVNGARSSMTSWQIEGSNNNDIWWNLPAANQSGISSIAGTEIPIDAIDQTSVETAGNSDNGGNPGATVNLVIKSGTNQLHGTLYYYNRNEALAVQNPFSSTKPKLRDQQFGYSAGGPTLEEQVLLLRDLRRSEVCDRHHSGSHRAFRGLSDAGLAAACRLRHPRESGRGQSVEWSGIEPGLMALLRPHRSGHSGQLHQSGR